MSSCKNALSVGLQPGSVAPLRYFSFGLALLLLDDFGLVADLASLADLHPHVLHIPSPFQKKNRVSTMEPSHRTLASCDHIVDCSWHKSTD
jgi:hypothetical protein